MDISHYFQSEQDYEAFLRSIDAMFENITIGGQRKIECTLPPYTGGSAALKLMPFRSLPKEGYWLQVNKMGKITLG